MLKEERQEGRDAGQREGFCRDLGLMGAHEHQNFNNIHKTLNHNYFLRSNSGSSLHQGLDPYTLCIKIPSGIY